MKKISVIIMTMVLLLTLVGCNTADKGNEVINEQENVSNDESVNTETNTTDEESTEEESEKISNIELSLEEIIDQMYENSGLEFPMAAKTELTLENMIYMLGVDNFEYVEGLTSEPMISSQAHSIVLFTVEDEADIEQIKKDVKENVDGRKWICVGVEQQNILVENVGNHIVLIMDAESETLMDAFLDIMK